MRFYKKLDKPLPPRVTARIAKYHSTETFRDVDEPLSKKADEGTQTTEENPQAEQPVAGELRVITEPEVPYLLSLLKQKMERMEDKEVLAEMHKRAVLTIKAITVDLVENMTPVMHSLGKVESVNRENVTILLYRCEKLYQVRQEASKILTAFIKLEHEPGLEQKVSKE